MQIARKQVVLHKWLCWNPGFHIEKKKTNLSLLCNRRCMYISSQKQSILLLTSL